MVGGIFVYAGLAKAGSEAAFADSVASFRLVPNVLIAPLALGLPPFEMLLGAWLIAGCWRRTAALCAALASGVFLAALTSAALRGLTVDCGCFGSGSPAHPLRLAVGRDVLLLAATVALYADARRSSHARNVAASRTKDSTASSGTNSR